MQVVLARHQKGFTVLELLVVIAIIGILSTIVLASLNSSRERGRVAKTVAQIRELEKALHLYYADTGVFPATCSVSHLNYSEPICVASNDPFRNSLGVSDWSGPYINASRLETGWGGHIGFINTIINPIDLDGDGESDYVIELDEDAPETDHNDNSSPIPNSSMIEIDEILDDGDLESGYMRRRNYSVGAGQGPWPGLFESGVVGELVYWFRL